jgi:hypothetical protein
MRTSPRPDWPPRYANVPVDVIKDDTIPPAAFRLYCKLRALAWGENTLAVDFDKLMELSGLSRTRLYEYARLLRDRTPLRWRVRGSVFECSFGEGDSESRKAGPLPAGDEQRPPGRAKTRGVSGESPNPGFRDSALVGESKDSTNFEIRDSPPPEAESRNPGKRDAELLLTSAPGGDILKRELALYYGGLQRRPPTAFKSPQQREAYTAAANALGGEFETLVKSALARDRAALSSLLAFLEACVRNRRQPARPKGDREHGPNRPDPQSRRADEPVDEATRIARQLSRGRDA